MGGLRKLLAREMLAADGDPMVIVTERVVFQGSGPPTGNSQHHLSCFVGGLLALGELIRKELVQGTSAYFPTFTSALIFYVTRQGAQLASSTST
jgi:hypothetical protein